MIVRALDSNHDWTFGKGRNNYLRNFDAINQNIKSRLLSWVGDCFFALQEGVDWRNLLDKGQKQNLELAIKTIILQSYGVIALEELSSILDENRKLTIEYVIDTIFGKTFENLQEQI